MRAASIRASVSSDRSVTAESSAAAASGGAASGARPEPASRRSRHPQADPRGRPPEAAGAAAADPGRLHGRRRARARLHVAAAGGGLGDVGGVGQVDDVGGLGGLGDPQRDPQRGVGLDVGGHHARRAAGWRGSGGCRASGPGGRCRPGPVDEVGQLRHQGRELVDDQHQPRQRAAGRLRAVPRTGAGTKLPPPRDEQVAGGAGRRWRRELVVVLDVLGPGGQQQALPAADLGGRASPGPAASGGRRGR